MPSRVKKRGRVKWLGRVQVNGKVKQKIFDTKKAALQWESQEKERYKPTAAKSLDLGEWSEKYLEFCEAKYTAKTYKEKRFVFRLFFQHIDRTITTSKMTPGQALGYLQKQAKKRSGNAANNDRKNLVAAWNWGMKYIGLNGPNPFLVERFPENRKPRYIPPEKDFWAVYRLARGQDRVMLAVAVYTAARRGEIYRLMWSDVDFEHRQIRLTTRKRRDGSMHADWLPMAQDLEVILNGWRKTNRTVRQEHLFVCRYKNHLHYGRPFKNRDNFLKKLCLQAEVKPFGWHAVRHLTATLLHWKGVPLAAIQAILRHRSSITTDRYLRSLGLHDTRPALESIGSKKTVSGTVSENPNFEIDGSGSF